jgi:hypothetical protein
MKQIILFAFLFCQCSINAQKQTENTSEQIENFPKPTISNEFINSFPVFETIVDMQRMTFVKTNPMTVQEALTHVYENDFTRLLCHGKFIDMETENVWGYYTDTVLPRKLGKIELGNTAFVFYTTNDCQDASDVWWTNVVMTVYKDTILQDIHTVCKTNDYETMINSLLNTKKNLLFIQGVDNENKFENSLLKLSEHYPYVTKIKSTSERVSTGDLLKALDALGWENDFK